jgi:hypothetical protein
MPVLDLPRWNTVAAWLRTVEILREDEDLSNAVQTWVVWDGEPPSTTPAFPLLELEPLLGPLDWYSPADQAGDLIVRYSFTVKSYDAEDYMNFFGAIVNALYPRNETERCNAIQASLRQCGAQTGQWTFAMPLTDPDPQARADGIYTCQGQMRLNMVHNINP